MSSEEKPIWYLPGPMFQYVEDVKALAREAGLRIIDANVTDDRTNAAEVTPEVTLKAADVAADMQPFVSTTLELDEVRREFDDKRDELQRMHADIVAERERLDAQATEQEVERQRLATLAGDLEAERVRLVELAAKPAAEQGAEGGKLTTAQLREALTAAGIEFDPSAKKADLQALLGA